MRARNLSKDHLERYPTVSKEWPNHQIEEVIRNPITCDILPWVVSSRCLLLCVPASRHNSSHLPTVNTPADIQLYTVGSKPVDQERIGSQVDSPGLKNEHEPSLPPLKMNALEQNK
ncbi:hypothetical protein CLAIMM_13301, partial [Cladophialophora immunda]